MTLCTHVFAGMWAPGAVGLVVGLALLVAVKDSPEKIGYPPVEIVKPKASQIAQVWVARQIAQVWVASMIASARAVQRIHQAAAISHDGALLAGCTLE